MVFAPVEATSLKGKVLVLEKHLLIAMSFESTTLPTSTSCFIKCSIVDENNMHYIKHYTCTPTYRHTEYVAQLVLTTIKNNFAVVDGMSSSFTHSQKILYKVLYLCFFFRFPFFVVAPNHRYHGHDYLDERLALFQA